MPLINFRRCSCSRLCFSIPCRVINFNPEQPTIKNCTIMAPEKNVHNTHRKYCECYSQKWDFQIKIQREGKKVVFECFWIFCLHFLFFLFIFFFLLGIRHSLHIEISENWEYFEMKREIAGRNRAGIKRKHVQLTLHKNYPLKWDSCDRNESHNKSPSDDIKINSTSINVISAVYCIDISIWRIEKTCQWMSSNRSKSIMPFQL